MRINPKVFLAIVVFCVAGCDNTTNDFQLKVDQVDELKGMILKGVSISGKVEQGCIANDDEFIVTREGQQILKTATRILNVKDLKDPEAFGGEVSEGDYVTFYIPDGKKDDIQSGDILRSSSTSCGKAPSEE